MSSPIRPRLRLAASGAALTCVAVLGLAGCGEEPEVDETTAQSPGDAPIQVTFEEGAVDPMGERVEVAVGEPIQIIVTSDVAGTLHVHSTPEQELEFPEGTSEHEVTLDQPGVVEVESHEPDVVVLQLEAR